MQLKLLCGLSASVELDEDGSFRPKEADFSTKPLLADVRWKGFAAAINSGIAEHLVMLGGVERVPAAKLPDGVHTEGLPYEENGEEWVNVSRAYATCHGLIYLYDVPREKLSWHVTAGNTLGNVGGIMRALSAQSVAPNNAAVSSNHYHIARAYMDVVAAGLGSMMLVPAEAFWFAQAPKGERGEMEAELRTLFGVSPLTERVIAEINGAADKLRNEYQSLSG